MAKTKKQRGTAAQDSDDASPSTLHLDVWTKDLNAIFDNAHNDTVTADDLALSVFRHVQPHVERIRTKNLNTLQTEPDLIYKVWEATIQHVCADRNIHKKILQFIQKFWKIVEVQSPEIGQVKYNQLAWYIGDNARGGPCEPGAPCKPTKNWEKPHKCNKDESVPKDGTFAEKRESWINYCRFAALITDKKIVDCTSVLDISMQGVLGGETWPTYFPDSALMAFEQVIDISGEQFWIQGGQWSPEEEGKKGKGLVQLWKGYEEKLRSISEDKGREPEAKESALRTLEMMKAIREKNEE